MEIQLKKFDITQIKDDKVVVLIGKRDTGKSYLCKDILYYHNSIPVGQVISGTEAANQFYTELVPKLFIHEEFNTEIVTNMLKRQKMMVEKKNNGENVDPRAFLILDDCLYDNKWTRDPCMRAVFMNGRHWKLLFILTMQYALGVPPNLRTNIDFIFILRENYVSNRKRLYEHYAGMFPGIKPNHTLLLKLAVIVFGNIQKKIIVKKVEAVEEIIIKKKIKKNSQLQNYIKVMNFLINFLNHHKF